MTTGPGSTSTPPHRDPPDRGALDLRLGMPAVVVWAAALLLIRAPVAAALAFGVSSLTVAVVAATARQRPHDLPRTSRLRRPSLTLTCGALTLLALTTGTRLAAREAGDLRALAEEGSTVTLQGTLRSVTALSSGAPGTSRVLIALHAVVTDPSDPLPVPTGAAVQLFLTDAPDPGSVVEFTARLAPPRSPTDRALATARPIGDLRIRAGPDPVTAALSGRRAALVHLAADLPGDAGALLPAVAVGDTSTVGDLDTAMRSSGLAHLTAVSGAHFSMVGAVVLALASWCGVPRRWRWLPVSVVSVGFVLLVGPGPTVLRAAVMGGVGVLGLAIGRPSRAVPALCAAVLALLIADPWLCTDLGFLLSVVATAGITTLAGPLALRWSRRLPRAAALALAVPVAAQAVCAPVILLMDPAVPLYAIPANIVAAPAVAPATVGGLLAALLGGWWPAAARCCASVAGAGCWWIGAVARTSIGLPGARVTWLAGLPGLLTLAVATAAGLALLLRCRRVVAP